MCRFVSGSRFAARRAQEDPAAPVVPVGLAGLVGLAHPVDQARRAGPDGHDAQVEVAVVLQAHQHLLLVVILVYLLQEALLDVLLVAQVQLVY